MTSSADPEAGKFGFWTATSVIIANMIGTGVFATLGYQLLEFDSGFLLMLLWFAGGVAALCGAVSYAELGALFPRSGGEYTFLARIYHPAAGFVSGWVSSTIGFAAPTAAVALAFGAYLAPVIGPAAMAPLLTKFLAAGLVLTLALVHSRNRKTSGGVQLIFTSLKIAVILFFSACALLAGDLQGDTSFAPRTDDLATLADGAFAVALIYVVYAYTGWNAATYLTSELTNVQKTLPRVLTAGSLVVMALYLLLNFVFLLAAPADALRGQTEIAYIAAAHLFGETGAALTGVTIAALLVSTVSAMALAGPRVLHVIGEDYPFFSALARRNAAGVPARAIFLQAGIALALIVTSSFEFILLFAGFTIALNSFLAVLGLMIHRVRNKDAARPFRTPLFPAPPLIYLALTGWMLVYALIERPAAGYFALAVVAIGGVVYRLASRNAAKIPAVTDPAD